MLKDQIPITIQVLQAAKSAVPATASTPLKTVDSSAPTTIPLRTALKTSSRNDPNTSTA